MLYISFISVPQADSLQASSAVVFRVFIHNEACTVAVLFVAVAPRVMANERKEKIDENDESHEGCKGNEKGCKGKAKQESHEEGLTWRQNTKA